MQILIIRHGDPDYQRDALSEKGKREAIFLSDRLSRLPIETIYVSPLGRARDTALPTLKKMNKQPVILDWLQEFPIHFPHNTGKNHVIWDFMPAYRAQHPKWNEQTEWMDDDPFYEHNVRPMVEHVWKKLDELLIPYGYIRQGDFYHAASPNTKTIALVCHLGIGTILLSHLINIPAQQLLHAEFMAPTSVTTCVTEERENSIAQFRTIGMGDTSHLYAAGEPISRAGFFQEAGFAKE